MRRRWLKLTSVWATRLSRRPSAAELSRTAQLGAPRDHGRPVPLPSIAGTAMLFMAAASKDKTAAQTALMVQLINTAFAVYEMHQQAGRIREAQRIRAVVTQQLAPFTATMPKPVMVGIGETPAAGAGTGPTAADIGRRGMAPVRPGSVVPSTPDKAKTHQHQGPDTGPVLDR